MRLLHDHVQSSKGVVIETGSPASSMFVQGGISTTSNQHSKIVTLDYIATQLSNGADQDIEDPLLVDSLTSNTSTMSISTSQYISYDISHSCNECEQLKKHSSSEIVISQLPSANHDPPIIIKWQIPSLQAQHFVFVNYNSRKCLKRVKWPLSNKDVKTPIFIPTNKREINGLFNLHHTGYDQLQVLVTMDTEFEGYCKAWPNMIIMGLPDQQTNGLGRCVCVLIRSLFIV